MNPSRASSPPSEVFPVNLRCEYEIDPIGVGSERPCLTWALAAHAMEQRGLLQSAYQVEAGSSREALEAGVPDRWESGRVASGESRCLYDGPPLASLQEVFWRVRVWDGAGGVSDWSAPAHWSTGMRPGDWKAEWITRSWEGPERESNTGFCTRPTRTRAGQAGAALVFDLGSPRRLDRVVLHPAEAFFQPGEASGVKNVYGMVGPGWAFPRKWVLEGASTPGFDSAVELASMEWDGVGFDHEETVTRALESAAFQFVRLRFEACGEVHFGPGERLDKMRPLLAAVDGPFPEDAEAGQFYCSALAELELWSGDQNVALGARVQATSSLELSELGFGLARLTDGHVETAEAASFKQTLLPVPHFRTEFEVAAPVRRAWLTYTAAGLCAFQLNGQPVEESLTIEPGWTFSRKWYDKEPGWVIVKSRDVTHLLKVGQNALGALLGDGWQRDRGGFGVFNGRNLSKEQTTALRVQLNIEYADGRSEIVGSGPDWQWSDAGPWRNTSMFDGVRYDARKALPGWSTPGFDAGDWKRAERAPEMDGLECVPYEGASIRVVAKLAPVRVTEPRPGVCIFDFGQNMAGVCHVVLDGPAGRRIRIRHAQELKEDGTLFLSHLGKSWKNSDDYILDGTGPLRVSPLFTFHGFRYAQVEGLGSREELREIEAWVLANPLRPVGHFESADARLNQLWSNLKWTVQTMLKSVVMDCVGRSERRGWMADGIGNLTTHAYCFDFANFTHKVLRDIRFEQTPSGIYDPVAPWGVVVENYAAAWSDSGVTVPAAVLAHYGDSRSVEEHDVSMERFMNRLFEKFPDGIVRDEGGLFWGDWLSFFMTHQPPKGEGPVLARQPSKEVFGTAWWYATTLRMAEIAEVLGKSEEADRWSRQAEWIRAQFNQHLIGPSGIIGEGTEPNICDTVGRRVQVDAATMPPRGGQGEIALALYMGLLDEEREATALEDLLEAIRAYRGKLSTGIHCTSRLLMALTDRGHHALAYRLAMDPAYPSYGYMIDQGATAIWESWDHWIHGPDGVTHPKHGIHDSNHPGLSGVGEWMFGRIVGIRPQIACPGFRRFTIEPHAEAGPEWAEGRLETVRGEVRCRWERLEGGHYVWDMVIPPNSEAEVILPFSENRLEEGGRPVAEVPGVVEVTALATGRCRILCGSGAYRFRTAAE